jgi:hypothetical protein
MAEIPYAVRVAPELLERIERIAGARGIAPRKLVRAVLTERFGGERGAHPDGAAAESSQYRTLDQILFDLTRTRLILQHLLDNQVGSEITDQIRQTAQAEAERYMQRLGREKMVMNLSRPAIRYEMNRSSAAMSLRLCLRFFVLSILVWAASDLFFVWYWTGRLGPGAHEYFGRWILAWLFTQKLPLYFLSLPYGKAGASTGGAPTASGSPSTAFGACCRRAGALARSPI